MKSISLLGLSAALLFTAAGCMNQAHGTIENGNIYAEFDTLEPEKMVRTLANARAKILRAEAQRDRQAARRNGGAPAQCDGDGNCLAQPRRKSQAPTSQSAEQPQSSADEAKNAELEKAKAAAKAADEKAEAALQAAFQLTAPAGK